MKQEVLWAKLIELIYIARESLCTWFGKFCSCGCLPLLPHLACSILPTTYKDLFGLCAESEIKVCIT